MTIPAPVLEAMCQGAYEATRTPSFPTWATVTEGYRADMRKALAAAVEAARRLGYELTATSSDRSAP